MLTRNNLKIVTRRVTRRITKNKHFSTYHKNNYDDIFKNTLSKLVTDGKYRHFNIVTRENGNFPYSKYKSFDNTNNKMVVWCSNDYLNMGQSPQVSEKMIEAIKLTGNGSGGTRNIAGTNIHHDTLEKNLADFHDKESALLFPNCYSANHSTIIALSKIMPDLIVFSDEKNHASLIEGIRHSKLKKHIFRHNDIDHLEELIKNSDISAPKIIIFESVYSMDGTIAPVKTILDIAEKYNCLSFIDEVHAIGLYGESGSGISERENQRHRIDIISGTLSKGVGVYGGYISASNIIIDSIRNIAPGFIFTSSLPPTICVGASESLNIIRKSKDLRDLYEKNTLYLKKLFVEALLPIQKTESHIIPLIIGDSVLCKKMADTLMSKYNIYLQPINFPTVPIKTERFRIVVTPAHTKEMMVHLVNSFVAVFDEYGIPRGDKN